MIIKSLFKEYNADYSAFEIASHIIKWYERRECGINNLKLNKILYLIQIMYLEKYNKCAFYEQIEYWRWGYAVRDVYLSFRLFLSDSINPNCKDVIEHYHNLPIELEKIINEACEKTKEMKAWDFVPLFQKCPAHGKYYVRGENVFLKEYMLFDDIKYLSKIFNF